MPIHIGPAPPVSQKVDLSPLTHLTELLKQLSDDRTSDMSERRLESLTSLRLEQCGYIEHTHVDDVENRLFVPLTVSAKTGDESSRHVGLVHQPHRPSLSSHLS